MVFKMGAILAFVVLWTLAEIVAGPVVAWGTILAGVGLTIIDVQLQGSETDRKSKKDVILGLEW